MDTKSEINESRFNPSLRIEENAPEHHYFYNASSNNHTKNFAKAVGKEVSILQNCLPQGIHVKSFEDRMDLFSSMIQGPIDTPYEGGVFFFDIQLPDKYPQVPPKVHYHSYLNSFWESTLNYNLYSSGKVCLSILHTMYGPGWDPSNSTLLQVLVSIQGLVLVKEPYFNHPGNPGKRGSKRSKSYNLQVLLRVMKSNIKIGENIPKLFAKEVRQHFKTDSIEFMKRVRNWIEEINVTNLSSSEVINFPISSSGKNLIPELNKLMNNFHSTIEKMDKGKVDDFNDDKKMNTIARAEEGLDDVNQDENLDGIARVEEELTINHGSYGTFEGYNYIPTDSAQNHRKPWASIIFTVIVFTNIILALLCLLFLILLYV